MMVCAEENQITTYLRTLIIFQVKSAELIL